MFGCLRFKNIRLTVIALVCTAAFIAVCFIALKAGAPDTVTVGSCDLSLTATDEADVTAFISACGYDAAELISDTDIKVPKHWNPAYTDYNDIQLAQGFDLTPYKGKPARELVFQLSESSEYLYLVLCDDKIIAAHISSYDGGDIRPLIVR